MSSTYMEKSALLEEAWHERGKQMLQSDIAMGRRLMALKEAGRQLSRSVLSDQRDMRISKTRAYSLIQLVSTIDQWIRNGWIQDESCLNEQTAEALHVAVLTDQQIQRSLCEAISEGQIITKRRVQMFEKESCAENSHLLPDFIRARVVDRALPAKDVAALAVQLSQLEPNSRQLITSALPAKAIPDDIKAATRVARQLVTIINLAPALSALQGLSKENIQSATHQAHGLDAAGLLADAMKNAQEVEAATLKLQLHKKRLAQVSDALAIECEGTPELKAVVQSLQALANPID